MRVLPKRPRAALATYTGFRPWLAVTRATAFWIAAPGFCIIYGAVYAIFTPYLLPIISIPLVVLLLITIWALPDAKLPPTQALVVLFYVGLVAGYVWPNYLALALPALPWITVSRLIGIPTLVIALVCLSTSSGLRRELSNVYKASSWLSFAVLAFTALQACSIGLSDQKGQSADKFILALTGQTTGYFLAAYVMLAKGQIRRVASFIWALAIFVGLIGIWQFRLHKLPWAGHIPGFLQISDPVVQTVLGGFGRAYTNEYRITSTFTTPLALSEFTALAYPFVIFFLINGRKLGIKIMAGLSLPFLFIVVILTDSRLGIIGCLLAALLYPIFVGLRTWRRDQSSLIGPAIGITYPAIFMVAIASTFLVGRVKNTIWGNGAKNFSTQSRIDQWHLGIPLIIHRPIGYGIGRAADTLAYAPFGMETIDSYYLSIALEYGLLGVLIFYGMFILAVAKSGLLAITPQYVDDEQAFSTPITISLSAWLVIKSVFSQGDNNGLVYLMLGMVAALSCRAARTQTLPETVDAPKELL